MKIKYSGIGKFILKILVIFISFIIVFGASFYFVQDYIQKATEVEMVAVAARDILPNELINKEDITFEERAVYGLGSDYLISLEEINGDIYTRDIGFGKGDVIRLSKLTTEDPVSYSPVELMSDLVKENKLQLISIDTNLTKSCANGLEPGSLVDGFVYIKADDYYGSEETDLIIGPDEDINLCDLTVYDVVTERGNHLDSVNEDIGETSISAVVTLCIDKSDYDRLKAIVSYNETGSFYLSLKGMDKRFVD